MHEVDADVLARAREVRLLALDVDGVFTAGELLLGNDGIELKAFNILDGVGVKLLLNAGVQVAVVTGRQSHLVAERMRKLGIRHVRQGREDKLVALEELCAELELTLEQIAYIGDDLPDLAAIRKAGLGVSVPNGDPFVVSHARWCTPRRGGEGAVRDVCELILAARGELDAAREAFL